MSGNVRSEAVRSRMNGLYAHLRRRGAEAAA